MSFSGATGPKPACFASHRPSSPITTDLDDQGVADGEIQKLLGHEVREILAKVPGSLAQDLIADREDRF